MQNTLHPQHITPVCPNLSHHLPHRSPHTSHTSPCPLQPRPATLCSPASTATRRSGPPRSSCCSILGCRCGLSCPGHALLPGHSAGRCCGPKLGFICVPSRGQAGLLLPQPQPAALLRPPASQLLLCTLLQDEAEISDAPFDDTIVQRLQRYGLYGRCGLEPSHWVEGLAGQGSFAEGKWQGSRQQVRTHAQLPRPPPCSQAGSARSPSRP